MTLIHATCVAVKGAGILIRGPSGSGKSDVALRLIDEGAALVADDYCTVSIHDRQLVAAVPDAIAGRLEVRGYGIVRLPYEPQIALKLVVDLASKDTIERHPDTASCVIDGVTVPRVFIDADTPSATAKIRVALASSAEGIDEKVIPV